jgi:hypothetical protein
MTMRVSLRRPVRPARPPRGRSGPAAVHARPRTDEPRATDERRAEAGPDELRARYSGGPEDKALYSCECGCAFHAPVSASVRCPRCHATQAW